MTGSGTANSAYANMSGLEAGTVPRTSASSRRGQPGVGPRTSVTLLTTCPSSSNNALLDRLFAIVQENINNPAVLQEKVNELRAIRDDLTAVVIRNTPAESENPPT